MRTFILFLLAVLLCARSLAIIGIGYSDKRALFWRFWEVKDGVPVPEILVYNTSDSSISFTETSAYVVDMRIDSARRKAYEEQVRRYMQDTLVQTAIIPAHQYGIYVIHDGHIPGAMQAAYVNGRNAGIAHKLPSIPRWVAETYPCKYYSTEGLYATPIGFIGKNHLVTRRGRSDDLILVLDITQGGYWQFTGAINDGISEADIRFHDIIYHMDRDNRKTTIPVTKNSAKYLELNVSITPERNATIPEFDFHRYFQNGNGGADLPVFVE